MRTIAHEGRTVLFSSHLLEEVERVADHVTMISHGRIALSAPLDAIKESHRHVTVRLAKPRPQPPDVAGVLRWEGGGEEWTAVHCVDSGEFQAAVAGWGARVVESRVPSLDEIFVAHVGPGRSGGVKCVLHIRDAWEFHSDTIASWRSAPARVFVAVVPIPGGALTLDPQTVAVR
jgi:ABC-2 type transport system ATP-binding protein